LISEVHQHDTASERSGREKNFFDRCGSQLPALAHPPPSRRIRDELKSKNKRSLLDESEHWHARAEEARLLAKEMKDSETKDALLRIGDNYEYLAEWVEDWALRRLSKN
jgi:hypothetical protein